MSLFDEDQYGTALFDRVVARAVVATLLVLLVWLCQGCASKPKQLSHYLIETPLYSGHRAIEQPVRQEIARQCALVGYATNRAHQVRIQGHWIEPVGQNAHGYYGELRPGLLVHGAYQGAFLCQAFEIWFAFPLDGAPDQGTLSHEVLHDTLVSHADIGGHPTEFEINGRKWTSAEILLPGTRWPMRAWVTVKRYATFWKDHTFRDVVNEEYYESPKTW